MFPITRYEVEEKPHVSPVTVERLSKINERIEQNKKRKRTQGNSSDSQALNVKLETGFKKNSAKNKGENKKETERVQYQENEALEQDNKIEDDCLISDKTFFTTSQVSLLSDEGLKESTLFPQQEIEGKPGTLEAFPSFENPGPSAKDVAVRKRMGIPDWLLFPVAIDPDVTFPLEKATFRLSQKLLDRCKTLGIHEFFAVQTAVIPILLRSRALNNNHISPGDICVSAPTGSGKTLSYVLPVIEILSKRIVTRLRVLVVLPTRDLVIQVKETFDAFCRGTNLKVGVITGHTSFTEEQKQIFGNLNERFLGGSSKVDILIATPGRLIDHLLKTPNFTLQHLRFLIIDEADRLLNQSYQNWLEHVLKATRSHDLSKIEPDPFDSKRVQDHDAVASSMMPSFFQLPASDTSDPPTSPVQKLLFSATLTRNPAKIASLHLVEPSYIAIKGSNRELHREDKYTFPSSLNEYMIIITTLEKPLVLFHLLHNHKITAALCFTKSVESAHRLAKLVQFFEALYSKKQHKKDEVLLEINGVPSTETRSNLLFKPIIAAEYSSELSQKERNIVLKKFKAGEIQLLVSSDLIARGIDLESVDTVINYDVPIYMKKYLHRVGRTARAGRVGDAYSLVEKQEANHFKDMLKKAGHLHKVKKMNIQNSVLNPMKATYQESLDALKNYMTVGKTSLANYQKSVMVQFSSSPKQFEQGESND
ncbi:hypothetical protein G9A89_013481 [Geosiphon pyriformis]|nr:hypothetical protein G9A89_013481 [Geosiphon pyriformis]